MTADNSYVDIIGITFLEWNSLMLSVASCYL